MTTGRKILAVTGLLVAGLAILFIVLGWRRIGAVAPAVAALAAVAGVGVSAWATFVKAKAEPAAPRRLTVRDTGDIKTSGGAEGVTGAAVRHGRVPGEVDIRRTGSIEGGGGVTGYRQG